MPERAGNGDLMRALGRLVRGLALLFWGIPIAFVIFGLLCIQTLTVGGPNPLTIWLQSLNIFPPVMATGLLFFGVYQLGFFQKQERVWQNAVERAKIVALINIGLAPFLFWWNRLPHVSFFSWTVGILLFSGLLFLVLLNQVLNRLAAMLPDETLRSDTRLFTSLNLYFLCLTVSLFLIYFVVAQLESLPMYLAPVVQVLGGLRYWLLLILVLIPVALTMTMIWKIKEAILASVFGPRA